MILQTITLTYLALISFMLQTPEVLKLRLKDDKKILVFKLLFLFFLDHSCHRLAYFISFFKESTFGSVDLLYCYFCFHFINFAIILLILPSTFFKFIGFFFYLKEVSNLKTPPFDIVQNLTLGYGRHNFSFSFLWSLVVFERQHQTLSKYLIIFMSYTSSSISWICFFSYLRTFSNTLFNMGLCVTNLLRPYVPENIFIIPSHLNDNLAGYKFRLNVLLSFQYFKNITIIFFLLMKSLRSW